MVKQAPTSRVRRRAELLYQQLDGLQVLRREVRKEFLVESRKQRAAKLLRQISCIGPIRAELSIALMQTPHRFRSQRQLWTYSGWALRPTTARNTAMLADNYSAPRNPSRFVV
jgi:transposase